MRRKSLDLILTLVGVGLTVLLLVGGALSVWAYSFANSNVNNQLAEQQITFPDQAALATPGMVTYPSWWEPAPPGIAVTPEMNQYLEQYAGQQLVTGPQAEAYADHFIAVYLKQLGGGLTYAQLSAQALALPKGSAAYTAAEAKVQTIFQGTTLQGLLLEAYAFWKFGQIALYGAIVAFVLAGLMALITVIGFLHYRRDPEDLEFPKPHHEPQHKVRATA